MIVVTIKIINKIVYAYSNQKNVKYNGAFNRKLDEGLVEKDPKIGKAILDITFINSKLKSDYTLCFNVKNICDDPSIENYCKRRLRSFLISQ